MTFEIDRAIIEKAKLCQKCYSCLGENGESLCRVKQSVEDKVFFIECEISSYCPYQKSFGGSVYCECPVRKEIFRKYGK